MDEMNSNYIHSDENSEHETTVPTKTRRMTIEELDELVGLDIDYCIVASNNLQSAIGLNLKPVPLAVQATHFATGPHSAPFRGMRGLPRSNSGYWGSPIEVKPTQFDFVDHRFDSLTEDEKDAVRILAGHVYVDEEPGKHRLIPHLTGDTADADRVRELLWSKRREGTVCPESLSIHYQPSKEPKRILEAKEMDFECPRSPSGRQIPQMFVFPKYPVHPDRIFRRIISPSERLTQTRRFRTSESSHSYQTTDHLPALSSSESRNSQSLQLDAQAHKPDATPLIPTTLDIQVRANILSLDSTLIGMKSYSSSTYSSKLEVGGNVEWKIDELSGVQNCLNHQSPERQKKRNETSRYNYIILLLPYPSLFMH